MTGLQAVTTNLARAAPASKKFSGSGLTARLVLDDETKADAYALRHRSYLSGGYIDPQPGGLFPNADDLRPNNRSIMIYKHRRPVASVRADAERLGGPSPTGWSTSMALRASGRTQSNTSHASTASRQTRHQGKLRTPPQRMRVEMGKDPDTILAELKKLTVESLYKSGVSRRRYHQHGPH
jgi:hypothetical protein